MSETKLTWFSKAYTH